MFLSVLLETCLTFSQISRHRFNIQTMYKKLIKFEIQINGTSIWNAFRQLQSKLESVVNKQYSVGKFQKSFYIERNKK